MTTVAYNNVLFICAARMAGQAIVVASYSYNTDTDLSAVKQALEQPSMNLSPGKHYSFNAGSNAWHFISGAFGFTYVIIELRRKAFYGGLFYNLCMTDFIFPSVDDQGLIYTLVCAANYPQRCAHMCLEELQRTVSKHSAHAPNWLIVAAKCFFLLCLNSL